MLYTYICFLVIRQVVHVSHLSLNHAINTDADDST